MILIGLNKIFRPSGRAIFYSERVKDVEVLIKTELRSMMGGIRERSQEWFGLIVCMTEERFLRRPMKWIPSRKREKEKPKKLTRKETLNRDIKEEIQSGRSCQGSIMAVHFGRMFHVYWAN